MQEIRTNWEIKGSTIVVPTIKGTALHSKINEVNNKIGFLENFIHKILIKMNIMEEELKTYRK